MILSLELIGYIWNSKNYNLLRDLKFSVHRSRYIIILHLQWFLFVVNICISYITVSSCLKF